MNPILTVVAASVTTFAATNVDDIFLLTLFVLDRWGHRIGPFVLIGLGSYLLPSHVTLTRRWIKANATTSAWATPSLLPAVFLAARCRALARVLSSTRRRPAPESRRESLR